MTREIYLSVSESFVAEKCREENVGISAIRSLACGGTRLVCMSVDGADKMRERLKKHLMKDSASRERHGPGWGFVRRD